MGSGKEKKTKKARALKKAKEEILDKNLWGVHKELFDKHWSFKKCVLNAMESYKNQEMDIAWDTLVSCFEKE